MAPAVVTAEDVDLDENEQPNLKKQAHRANLGACILLSAVQDYKGLDESNHSSAKRFLYPQDEAYRRYLELVCGMTSWRLVWLRETLDQLRPKCDAARRERKG